MDLNKIPRWALIVIATIGLGACGALVSTARADLYKFRTIAYQAKNSSESNTQSIIELKGDIAGVKLIVETIRKESREDFKDIQKQLSSISRSVS